MNTILIIEDDLDSITVLRKSLATHGFKVITAQDGTQGTSFGHSEKPALIILDLGLPAGGGLMTLKNLKLSSHTKFIPVIVVSGTDDQDLIEKVRQEGIEDFIQKPYESKDLIAKIELILLK